MYGYIGEYHARIMSGEIVAGKWIKLLYNQIVKRLDAGTVFFDEAAAAEPIEWIEAHCYHTEGPLAPGPFLLELWQKAALSLIYGVTDQDGRRVYREIVLLVARKNGKSLLAAAIGRYEWMRGGYGARVFLVAPKLGQTDIIYNSIWNQTTLDPEYQALKAEVKAGIRYHERKKVDDSALPKHRQTDLYIAAQNASVIKLPYSVKRSDGYNPSLVICDEVAAWYPPDSSLKQYEVMKSALGAREMGDRPPLLLTCTTSGYVNDGIYDELLKRSTRLLLGDSTEARLLPLLYMVDDPERWDDVEELKKANPNLGVSLPEAYLREEIEIARGSASKRSEILTKYSNIKQNSSMAWLPSQVVEKASGDAIDLADFAGCYCVGGVDLSQTRDLSACCAVIEKDGELYVYARFYLPAEKIDEATARDGVPYQAYIQRGLLVPSGDNFIDYHDCFRFFTELVERHKIFPLKIGFDRYSASYLIQSLKQYGFHCDDVYQGENLYGPLQLTQGLLEDGKIHIGDNDILKAHLLNGALKMSVERGRGKLVKLSANLHIDGAAALIDAMTMRDKYAAEIGEQLKNRGK